MPVLCSTRPGHTVPFKRTQNSDPPPAKPLGENGTSFDVLWSACISGTRLRLDATGKTMHQNLPTGTTSF